MEREPKEPAWTTYNEIEHIRSIIEGSCFSKASAFAWPGPEAMLWGYLAGAKIRTDWGIMESETIIRFAEEQLSLFSS